MQRGGAGSPRAYVHASCPRVLRGPHLFLDHHRLLAPPLLPPVLLPLLESACLVRRYTNLGTAHCNPIIAVSAPRSSLTARAGTICFPLFHWEGFKGLGRRLAAQGRAIGQRRKTAQSDAMAPTAVNGHVNGNGALRATTTAQVSLRCLPLRLCIPLTCASSL